VLPAAPADEETRPKGAVVAASGEGEKVDRLAGRFLAGSDDESIDCLLYIRAGLDEILLLPLIELGLGQDGALLCRAPREGRGQGRRQ
jgi:hypothetical protein